MFERSELVFPPECQLAHLGTSCGGDGFGWSGAPTLLLVTFLGEAKKVSGCRVAPGLYPRSTDRFN